MRRLGTSLPGRNHLLFLTLSLLICKEEGDYTYFLPEFL